MKYILVTGGCFPKAIREGVTACSIGTLMKACDLNVTAIKIDSEYNASLLYDRREELFVLEDGSEVHRHLGCFERFVDVTLRRDNYIRTKPVDVKKDQSPYIEEFLVKIEQVATTPVTNDQTVPDVCIIQFFVNIFDGKYMVEALRQLRSKVMKEDTCCIQLCNVYDHLNGKQILELRNYEMDVLEKLGFKPDLVICHFESTITDSIIAECCEICHVSREQVISIHSCSSIYEVPLLLESQNVIDILADRLQLNIPHQGPRPLLQQWKDLVDRCKKCKPQVEVALVGNNIRDVRKAYESIVTALRDAALEINYELNVNYFESTSLEASKDEVVDSRYDETWQLLRTCSALIVTDGFKAGIQAPHPIGLEGRIEAIKWARENKIPFLGIGQGMELAVIEFARNVLSDNTDVNSQNWFQTIMEPQDYPCLPFLRVGSKTTSFCTQDSITRKLYGGIDEVNERHRRERDLSPYVINNIERGSKGLRFVGKDFTSKRMEIMELDGHPYFVGLQFHPEYTSRPFKPAPPFLGLVLAATDKLKDYLDRKEGVSDSEQLVKEFQNLCTC